MNATTNINDRIRDLTIQEIKENKDLSKILGAIALDFYDSICESELYEKMKIINASHPGMICGHIDFDEAEDERGHKSRYALPGCSIEIHSFSVNENLVLTINKTVSVGFNTDRDAGKYLGHDYIAPTSNCYRESVEKFSIKNASEILDVIDEICTRTMQEQIDAIKDVDNFDNGENFETFKTVYNKVKTGEKVKFSFFKSAT